MDTRGYRERQKMDDIIVYIILAVMALANLIIYRFYQVSDLSFFYMSVLTLIFFLLVSTILQLTVNISGEGISYRFFPFHRKEKIIKWDDIKYVELMNFRPLRDYGGYGIRFNLGSKAYIIRGKKGLKIYWKNDRKPWVIGISDEDKIKEAISVFAPKLNVKDSIMKKN